MNPRSIATSLVAASYIVAGSAFAAEDRSWYPSNAHPAAAVPTEEYERAQLAPKAAGAFGLLAQEFWVGATEFHPREGTRLDYDAFAFYRAATGSGNQLFDAKINLPAGALVTGYDCFVADFHTTANVLVDLWKQSFDVATNTPLNVQLASLASTGSSGLQTPTAAPFTPFTVQYREGSLRNHYTFILFLQGSSLDTAFRACRVFWQRQISPAPASAAFTDVPTSHPFFQFVEALRASGITLGCSATQYCPDAPVTRAQMAAFLARMGGLHWPF